MENLLTPLQSWHLTERTLGPLGTGTGQFSDIILLDKPPFPNNVPSLVRYEVRKSGPSRGVLYWGAFGFPPLFVLFFLSAQRGGGFSIFGRQIGTHRKLHYLGEVFTQPRNPGPPLNPDTEI